MYQINSSHNDTEKEIIKVNGEHSSSITHLSEYKKRQRNLELYLVGLLSLVLLLF